VAMPRRPPAVESERGLRMPCMPKSPVMGPLPGGVVEADAQEEEGRRADRAEAGATACGSGTSPKKETTRKERAPARHSSPESEIQRSISSPRSRRRCAAYPLGSSRRRPRGRPRRPGRSWRLPRRGGAGARPARRGSRRTCRRAAAGRRPRRRPRPCRAGRGRGSRRLPIFHEASSSLSRARERPYSCPLRAFSPA
jgi:hypothetical protein